MNKTYLKYSLNQLNMLGPIEHIIIKDLYKIHTGDRLNSTLYGFVGTIKYVKEKHNKNITSLIPKTNRCLVNGHTLTLTDIQIDDTLEDIIPYLSFNDYWESSLLDTKPFKDIKLIKISYTEDIEAYKLLLAINEDSLKFKLYSYKTFCILHNSTLYILRSNRFNNKLIDDIQGYSSPFHNYEKYQEHFNSIKLHLLNKVKNDLVIDIVKGITYKDKVYKNTEELYLDFNLLEECIKEIDFNKL